MSKALEVIQAAMGCKISIRTMANFHQNSNIFNNCSKCVLLFAIAQKPLHQLPWKFTHTSLTPVPKNVESYVILYHLQAKLFTYNLKFKLFSIQDLFHCLKISKSAKSISVVLQIRTYWVFDISQPLGWGAALQTFQIFRFYYLRKRCKGAGISHLFFFRSPRSPDSGEHNIVYVALLEAEISTIMYTCIYSIWLYKSDQNLYIYIAFSISHIFAKKSPISNPKRRTEPA